MKQEETTSYYKERLLSVKSTAELLDVSIDQVWRLTRDKDEDFPKPVKLKRSTRWKESELVDFIDKLSA